MSETTEVTTEVTEGKSQSFSQDDVNGIVARSTAKAAEKARSELLSSLGFSSEDDLKTVVTGFKEFQESKKTAEQRLAEVEAKDSQLEAQLNTYRDSIQNFLEAELEKIPEDKRSLVPDFDDPAAKLEYIAKNRTLLVGEPVVNVGAPTQPGAPTNPSPVSFDEFKKMSAMELNSFQKENPEVFKAYTSKMKQGY